MQLTPWSYRKPINLSRSELDPFANEIEMASALHRKYLDGDVILQGKPVS